MFGILWILLLMAFGSWSFVGFAVGPDMLLSSVHRGLVGLVVDEQQRQVGHEPLACFGVVASATWPLIHLSSRSRTILCFFTTNSQGRCSGVMARCLATLVLKSPVLVLLVAQLGLISKSRPCSPTPISLTMSPVAEKLHSQESPLPGGFGSWRAQVVV